MGGADTFAFGSLSLWGPLDSINYVDTVTDFKQGGDADSISLAGITGPVLAFAGNTTTVTANSVNWFESGNITIVQADVNGNDIADFQLALRGTGLGLTAADFIL
jgi:hypothetical protein